MDNLGIGSGVAEHSGRSNMPVPSPAHGLPLQSYLRLLVTRDRLVPGALLMRDAPACSGSADPASHKHGIQSMTIGRIWLGLTAMGGTCIGNRMISMGRAFIGH